MQIPDQVVGLSFAALADACRKADALGDRSGFNGDAYDAISFICDAVAILISGTAQAHRPALIDQAARCGFRVQKIESGYMVDFFPGQ